jgi:ABC-type branched-subunit amino acid transport system permease subunit
VISAVTCALAGALVAQQNQYFNSDFITFNLPISSRHRFWVPGPSLREAPE